MNFPKPSLERVGCMSCHIKWFKKQWKGSDQNWSPFFLTVSSSQWHYPRNSKWSNYVLRTSLKERTSSRGWDSSTLTSTWSPIFTPTDTQAEACNPTWNEYLQGKKLTPSKVPKNASNKRSMKWQCKIINYLHQEYSSCSIFYKSEY